MQPRSGPGGPGTGMPHDTESRSSETWRGDTPNVTDQAKETAGQVKDLATELASTAKQQASTRLSGQINQAAQTANAASHALRDVGTQLREQDQPMLADGAERLAETVERLATNLEGKDLDQIVDDVEEFARRQSAVFLGGAFALGLIAARFLKSSSQGSRRDVSTSPSQYGRPPYGSQSQVYASQSEWESRGLRSMPGGMGTQQTPRPTSGTAPGAFRPVDEPESSVSSPGMNPARPAQTPSSTGTGTTGGTTSGGIGGSGSSTGAPGSPSTSPGSNPPREEPERGSRSA